MDFLPWTEKYRPKSLDEIKGQEHIVNSLKSFVAAKNMPNLLFAGPPGVGKTTCALVLAHELYGKDWKGLFLELNASDERGIDIVRGRIKDFARSATLSNAPFKLVFLDEGDALTADAQQALRRTMETYSSVTRFIISANYSSRIIEPIQSRCAVFRFFYLPKEKVLETLRDISEKEGLNVEEDALDAIHYVSEGDMRKAINILQGAAFHSNKITKDLIHRISSRATPKEISEMVIKAIKGDFKEARDLLNKLTITYGMSGEDIVFQIYREVGNLEIDEKKRMKIIEALGEHNYRLVLGANDRIQIEALLAKLAVIE